METGRAVLQVKKFNMIQNSNIVLLQNLLDKMGLGKTGMHCFSTLDAVGSHLHVADRSICDQNQMYSSDNIR